MQVNTFCGVSLSLGENARQNLLPTIRQNPSDRRNSDVISFFLAVVWLSLRSTFCFCSFFFLTQTGDGLGEVEMICIYLTNFSLTVSKPCMSFLAVLLCSACLSKNKVVYQSGVGFLCMNCRVVCCVLQQWLDNSWWTLSFLATVK